jgi:hypothetical protein
MKLVGERRALASAVFLFYCLMYMLNGYMGDPAMSKFAYAVGGVYGLAFFSLVAGYFWARWYSLGVGLYGVILAAVGFISGKLPEGSEGILMFVGGTHLAATLSLWGSAMAGPYDGQTAWREKFHMDDHAVQRLGRAVIRAGVSLPLVLAYALAPRPGSLIISLALVALTGLGLRALLKLKTWGVLALGSAGFVLLALAGVDGLVTPALAGALLVSSAVPFAGPMARWLAVR